jgi:hypothetical protein
MASSLFYADIIEKSDEANTLELFRIIETWFSRMDRLVHKYQVCLILFTLQNVLLKIIELVKREHSLGNMND